MMTERFLDYIAYEKRYSQNTINAYRSDLAQFSAFLDTQYDSIDISAADHQIVRSWVVRLMEEGHTARTVNRKITTLKTYFRFLNKEGMIGENPMSRVIAPKTSKRLPVFIEQDGMNTLFTDIDYGEGYPAARDRMIMELFYATGMRLSELIGLKEQDIDFYKQALKVTGKRNKQRIIPFTDHVKGMLKEYVEVKRKEFPGAGESSNLLLTNKGEQLYPRLVYRIVKHYLDQVTTISKRSPHVIRHTFATHMLNNGADLNAIKEILGHANLAATQVYTHNTIEKLKSIYKQAHPRA
jgi:integrase/recombinase XerC